MNNIQNKQVINEVKTLNKTYMQLLVASVEFLADNLSFDEGIWDLSSRGELVAGNFSKDGPFFDDLSKPDCFRDLLSTVKLVVDNLSIYELFIEEWFKDEGFWELLYRVDRAG